MEPPDVVNMNGVDSATSQHSSSISSSAEGNRKEEEVVDDSEPRAAATDSTGTEQTPETSYRNSEGVGHANDHDFAPTETKAVFWLKMVVLAVLVLSTVAVALAVYFYTSTAEQDEFKESFQDGSEKVFEVVGRRVGLTLGAVDSYVVGLVSFARYAEMEWPFVTLPDYAVRLAKARSLSQAVSVNSFYLVSEDQRERWQNYTLANDEWVLEGLHAQKYDESYRGTVLSEYDAYGVIYNNDGDSEGPGQYGYFPIWQSAPIVPTYPPYNWDGSAYSPLVKALPELMESKRVVISELTNVPDPNDPATIAEAEIVVDWVKDYISDAEDPSEPMAEIYYPILDNAADEVSHDRSVGNVVGVLALTIFWRELIQNALPLGTEGVVCVIQNTCGQTFTYQLNGPDIIYLGPGDLHDNHYDSLGVSRALDLDLSSDPGNVYTGIPLSVERCPYLMHVYPSQEKELSYRTNNPAIFTVVVVCIFVFTSLIFLAYDLCVERRQRKVMSTALQSTANVLLLEDKVQERTKKLQESNKSLEEANVRITTASALQLRHFACMSHEIRTPLNCIIGLSSLLQESELNPMQAESMDMIVSSSDLLLTVVNDVLDYSKLESGNVDIEIRPSSLQETLSCVVQALEVKAAMKNVSLRTFYGATVCDTIRTDTRRLQQILYNLLGNAIKFSEDGSHVELHVSLCERRQSRRACEYRFSPSDTSTEFGLPESTRHQALRFSIRDYGPGIAKKDFQTIFEPFRQAGTEIERLHGGTGLGLAIAAKLVHGLGGSIAVDSDEGSWTEFSVDLPFNEAPADIMKLSACLEDVKILHVCDEPFARGQAREIFRACSIDYTSFDDMKALGVWIGSQRSGPRNDSYICLVKEDLYDATIYNLLSTSSQSTLVAFGPRRCIPDAQGSFRSLLGILPSVLIKQLILHAGIQCPGSSSRRVASLLPLDDNEQVERVPYNEFRVLVAEDNTINQKVLLRMLNRLGIENVDIVDNGQKAVDREAEVPFDIVLMDMQMPVMDGIEACNLIKQRQGGHPHANVFFVTAHAAEEFEAECFQAGASGFITKPFHIRDIESCFQTLHAMMA